MGANQGVEILARHPRLAAHAARAQERRAEQEARPQQMFLPGLGELTRAMPNHVARSSLFAPIARGRRKAHVGTILVSRSDATLEYWGEQLDEADADIIMQLMFEARLKPLGEAVALNRAALLRAIGRRGVGKHDYEWLHRRIKALTAATLIIEVRKRSGTARIGDTESFRIIQSFRYDASKETYTYTIDPRWKAVYGAREYALVDWEKRLKIGQGHDMAKALQRLVATSDDSQQRFGLEWLKDKLQYAGRKRDFRVAMRRAMQELERLEIITAGRIETSTKGREQAAWTRL